MGVTARFWGVLQSDLSPRHRATTRQQLLEAAFRQAHVTLTLGMGSQHHTPPHQRSPHLPTVVAKPARYLCASAAGGGSGTSVTHPIAGAVCQAQWQVGNLWVGERATGGAAFTASCCGGGAGHAHRYQCRRRRNPRAAQTEAHPSCVVPLNAYTTCISGADVLI